MIHYALRCQAGHEFDGWFKSSVSFDAQAGSGLLDCPVCASTSITRALMAPRIAQGAAAQAGQFDAPAGNAVIAPIEPGGAQATPAPLAGAANPPPAGMPDQVRAVLQRIRSEVEKRCEYVGPHFAREVRRMAGGETGRPVYGEATPEEAAALADDGIDVARIPWVQRADS